MGKTGFLDPNRIASEEALTMMVAEPLLIGRPLMQVGAERQAGFDVAAVHRWIGLRQDVVGSEDPQYCPCVKSED